MKKIKLSQGKYALVDNEDFEFLSQWSWCFDHGYAVRGVRNKLGRHKKIYMHREITKFSQTDHIDGNGINNQRVNLRESTQRQNCCNRKKSSANKSGFKGVYTHTQKKEGAKRFVALIQLKGIKYHLGLFLTAEEAHEAYKKAAISLHREFARF